MIRQAEIDWDEKIKKITNSYSAGLWGLEIALVLAVLAILIRLV
jgi:hypothetical protein